MKTTKTIKTTKATTLYWSAWELGEWRLYLAATEKGLCYVGSPDGTFDEMVNWARRSFPDCEWIEDSARLQPYAEQLGEYARGERRTFAMPSDLSGTPFQLAVWRALLDIPYGETRSYSDIAEAIRKPAAVRAVGAAIGANPVLVAVPCHRVVGKNGSLTGYRGGLPMKTVLLKLEGER
ncbi:methylated-DNA--[protein]-cysteine S-methyltransferase [Paenibacillus sp. NPDC058071]|uniref:methylated-DNA--[protein]-cysteine S-methyltransferase n=1 Tax=Paenibacillus sp. NPDC058071 TaxID=3346326 RepID=UPI0036DE4785